jgi:Hg(II)-responsive transcriptional regulator
VALMTIGELARRIGVNTQTIRFYEREGLVPAPRRRASGYRQYAPAMVERVRFIRAAKAVGFTLEEIADLLSLRVRRGASCARVRARAEAKLADIDAKLEQLRGMRAVLAEMVESCSGRCAIKDCAILEAIEAREAEAVTAQAGNKVAGARKGSRRGGPLELP